jgi:hypothetical protein
MPSIEKKRKYNRDWYWRNRESRSIYAKAYRVKNRAWLLKREKALRDRTYWKVRALVDAKKDVPCLDCGGQFPPECMDFDHVKGSKRFTIGASMQRGRTAVEKEMKKCEVVCANCHRIRSRSRRARKKAL